MPNNDAVATDLTRAETLWKAADALHGQIDAAEHKHVVLGLLFKYISDLFGRSRSSDPRMLRHLPSPAEGGPVPYSPPLTTARRPREGH